MHALIIEDIPLVAFSIEDELRDAGYLSCAIAGSKSEALEWARTRSPDLIVADFRLADGTGVDAVREICRGRSIPTIYVAAFADEVLQQEDSAVVLEKPVLRRELLRALRRVSGQAAVH